MVQKNQKWNKILDVLYHNPNKGLTVRQLAKQAKLPVTTTQRYLEQLQHQGIINKDHTLHITPYTKFHKATFMIDKLFTCGLIDELKKILTPTTIILFGGVRKGEYDQESDIDLFIATTKKIKPDLKAYEKKLGHKIDLFIEKDLRNLPPRLMNNVLNGIKLSGYVKVK